ncbi:MAG: hypothetical protein ABIQ09_03440 [Jatrophihabitantaceae bacterium]
MLTRSAISSAVTEPRMVSSRAALAGRGVTRSQLRAQLAARRWRLCGNAVVLHNGPLTRQQAWTAALINVGPRAMLTAFTAAECHGLRGWEREKTHVLAPLSVSDPVVPELRIQLHRTRRWTAPSDPRALRCQSLAPALVLAASTFESARPGCGLLAAAVQQRLVDAEVLETSLNRAIRTRHRAALLAAVRDIAGGSQALSELDFVRLCHRNRLPPPWRQQLRREPSGRRRYLDASWRRSDGRLVVVEVDGALHLNPRRWWDDQLRQNELSLADALVLRFPSVIVRTEEATVVRQLRRALRLPPTDLPSERSDGR